MRLAWIAVTFSIDNIALGTDYTPDVGTVYFDIYFSPMPTFLTRADFFKRTRFKVEARNKRARRHASSVKA